MAEERKGPSSETLKGAQIVLGHSNWSAARWTSESGTRLTLEHALQMPSVRKDRSPHRATKRRLRELQRRRKIWLRLIAHLVCSSCCSCSPSGATMAA